MGILTDWLDGVFERSWNRTRERKTRARAEVAPQITASIDVPQRYTGVSRQFTVRDGLNGTFIEFVRHKWNPNKSAEYESCIYIVKDDETLSDAIATVLVLMDKPEV